MTFEEITARSQVWRDDQRVLNARAGIEEKPDWTERTPDDILGEALVFQSDLKKFGVIQ